MTQKTDWQAQVGRSWAEMYPQTDRAFSGLTQHLLTRIAARAGTSVLDIGCGAGELSLAVARARPRARVIGVDVSADLVAVATRRGDQLCNARFVLGDAASWEEADSTPDLLISRHGVMFFPDPVAAFRHLRSIAAPDAELVFSCFRSPHENPWATEIAALLDVPPAADPFAPGPFAFADPQHVEAILAEAGWCGIDFERVDFAYVAGKGDDPVADAAAFFARIGPAARALHELSGAARVAAEAKLNDWLAAHRSGDIVAMGAAGWVVTTKRS